MLAVIRVVPAWPSGFYLKGDSKMPTYTLRLDKSNDKQYIKNLKSVMTQFRLKRATRAFEKCINEYLPMKNNIIELEKENQRLSDELRLYKQTVGDYLRASHALSDLE